MIIIEPEYLHGHLLNMGRLFWYTWPQEFMHKSRGAQVEDDFGSGPVNKLRQKTPEHERLGKEKTKAQIKGARQAVQQTRSQPCAPAQFGKANCRTWQLGDGYLSTLAMYCPSLLVGTASDKRPRSLEGGVQLLVGELLPGW